jgi:hypothetical protein
VFNARLAVAGIERKEVVERVEHRGVIDGGTEVPPHRAARTIDDHDSPPGRPFVDFRYSSYAADVGLTKDSQSNSATTQAQ